MNRHALDSLITDYEPFIASVELPDRDDRHVVAAALRCGASAIVTFNTRDFPRSSLDRFDLEVTDPDDFLVQQFYLYPSAVVAGARRHRSRLQNPPRSSSQYLETLEQQRLPRLAVLLREHRASI